MCTISTGTARYVKIVLSQVVLLSAWASILKYYDDYEDGAGQELDNEKFDFFKGITVFCWVMVILYLITYTFSLPKICNCKRPSMFTLTVSVHREIRIIPMEITKNYYI